MKKFAAILLALALVLGITNTASATASPFTDVSETHWAYWDIYYLYVDGSIGGYGDGTFRPENTVTRAEASKIISETLDYTYQEPHYASFTDVMQGHWAYMYVQPLADRGIVSGVTPTLFHPNDKLTRAQMAKIITLAYDLPPGPPYGSTGFQDVDADAWYGDYVNRLVGAGITTGYNGTLFKPNDYVTRAQIAAFVNRANEFKLQQ